MGFKETVVLLSVCVVLTYATPRLAVIKPGKCPKPSVQANFNRTEYLGTWYEYERFGNWFQILVECGRAEYGVNAADQSISVLNAGTRRFRVFGNPITIGPVSIVGKATTPDPTKPAELTVSFSEFQPTSDTPNYFVVETDYKNYAVVFSCDTLPGNLLNLQFAWILTRERGVAPADLAAIKANLSAANIDVSKLFIVNQENCPSS